MAVGGFGDTACTVFSQTRSRVSSSPEYLTFLSLLFFILIIASATHLSRPAQAQNAKPGVVDFGDLVVTGASGTLPPPATQPLPPGVNELDETFINPDGASLKVFDVRNPNGPPEAQLLNAPVKFQAFARDIGQVFGLALDKSNPPNIYATSTSVHGLQIVVPDADGDGRPERIKLGQPGASWMNGQFGAARGGGPGTVWKINGETGKVMKFADILNGGAPNSGPGLGNIAYDAKRKQLFVSDLDTGFVHRLDMAGTDLGIFDHGLQGRPANGMNATPDDGARSEISSPAFDAEDSGSWGMTSPDRRVWGLAVRGDRLYYAVEAGPQIWSIGINQDGSFGGDPRWELDVPSDPNAYPVSDIAFQGNGRMLLAQRGGISSRYDYSQYHTPRKTRVLRYKLESPDDAATPSRWVAEPEDYAIGFPGIHRNTSGGIAIGYGYKKNTDGSYGLGSCEGTLWTTGDALRDNPVHGARLAQGGPLNVHGLQGNALSLVRPKNEPPWSNYYVDFDGQFDDPQASGHVGDVEIARKCRSAPKRADLRILKKSKPKRCAAGEPCTYEVEIRNVGALPYTGPLLVFETADGGAKLVGHSPPAWTCKELFPGNYECTHPPVTLAPGEKRVLELTFELPPWWERNVYRNCADLRIPGFDKDPIRYNNRSCEYVPICKPGEPNCKADLLLEKFPVYFACDAFGNCHYVIRITNVGADVYSGPLHIHDTITQPASVFADWGPKPDWICGPLGVNVFDCTHGVVNLAPGDFRELHIYTIGPPLGLGHTHERNCARIDWKGGPGDINPFNEYDCAEVSLFPPGHPDARPKLALQKKGAPICFEGAGPGGGWLCWYEITVRNSGGAPYMGPLVVSDTSGIFAGPADSTLVNHSPVPPWNCAPGDGVAGTQTCTHPAEAGGILPGDSRVLTMFLEWPAGIAKPNAVQNCAKVSHDNDGDGVAEEIEDCVTTIVCTPGGPGDCPDDLSVQKYVNGGDCWPGFPCDFGVEISNPGQNDFPAGLVITDVPNPDAGAMTQIFPPAANVTCIPAGANHTCTVNNPIPAGGSVGVWFQLDVPPAYPWTTLKNCANIPAGPGNLFNMNDEDCAIAYVPGPDLAPHSDTICQLGAPCSLPASIDNKGQRDFKGSAGVKGTLSPELQITGITSKTSGFSCAKTGNASYECKGPSLSIKAGGAVEYELTVSVPANYPHSQVSHIKNMVWPDSKVKDRNPQNDQHISIITIEQPKKPPPPPPPPPPPAGKPDLAVSKTANQGASRAGGPSGFTVTVTNVGNAPYSGPINIQDSITPSSSRLTSSGPLPWRCSGRGGSFGCSHPQTTLLPGQSKVLSLTFTLPRRITGTVNNCAEIRWGGASQTRGSIRNVQSALLAQGYNPGPADGKPGRKTTNAIRAYQAQKGLPVTGRIDPALIASLLGGPDSGDSNPTNNRACAIASIIGQPPPPPPPVCTGGRSRNNYGTCVCPSHIPVWTGAQCIQPPPQQCIGGRYRNNKGVCVCPADKPNWSGRHCFVKEELCTGNRIRQNGVCVCPPSLPKWNGQYCSGIPGPQPCSGGRFKDRYGKCVCPSTKPIWNGQYCAPKPQQCTGGRYSNNKGQCVCPVSKPTWTGVICIPKINICSGGRIFSLQKKKCVCPSNKPNWNGKQCVSKPSCSGGRYYNPRTKSCTCPSNKPSWNGSQCVLYTTNPGRPPGEVTPGPSQPSCSGGRYYNPRTKSCACPSNKPMWKNGKCQPFQLQQGPVLKLPPGIKFPGIKIQ